MDLAGLAALLALPAGLLAAVTPAFQERTWASHLDRVVRLLESDMKLGDLEEQMLVSIRARLVERIAIATLLPRNLALLFFGVAGLVGGIGSFIAVVFQVRDLSAETGGRVLFQGGADALAMILVGVSSLLMRRAVRDKRLIELRETGTVKQREPEDVFRPRTEPIFGRRKRAGTPPEE